MGKYITYDVDKYIPKGYILPSGEMLTKSYGRFHIDMATRYIKEHCQFQYDNDIIKDVEEFMLIRVGAVQITVCGEPIIVYCECHQNKVIEAAIVSYLEHGWTEIVLDNPYKSTTRYLRELLYGDCAKDRKLEGEENENKNDKQNVLKRY